MDAKQKLNDLNQPNSQIKRINQTTEQSSSVIEASIRSDINGTMKNNVN